MACVLYDGHVILSFPVFSSLPAYCPRRRLSVRTGSVPAAWYVDDTLGADAEQGRFRGCAEEEELVN